MISKKDEKIIKDCLTDIREAGKELDKLHISKITYCKCIKRILKKIPKKYFNN